MLRKEPEREFASRLFWALASNQHLALLSFLGVRNAYSRAAQPHTGRRTCLERSSRDGESTGWKFLRRRISF